MAEEREREILLEVKDLEVTYGSGRKAYRAVNCANFNIYKGETFGLVASPAPARPPSAGPSCAFCPPLAVRSCTRARRSTAKSRVRWTSRSPVRSR